MTTSFPTRERPDLERAPRRAVQADTGDAPASPRRGIVQTLISVVLGIGAAAATSMWMQSRPPAADTARVKQSPTAAQHGVEVRTVIKERVDEDRLAALQKEMDELRAQRSASASDPSEEPPVSPEEERAAVEQQFATYENTHREQPRDPTWATSAETNLKTGLGDLAKSRGFSVSSVECKTTSCRAHLVWSDHERGRRTAAELVANVYPHMNCLRSIYLPDRDDSSAGPGEANLFLDCSLERAGKAESVQ